MLYITKDIVTAEWVTKKQFYSSVGMQDFTTWEIVQIRQFVGEFSKQELIDLRISTIDRGTPTAQELADRLAQSNLQVAEIDSKLLMFP